MNGSQFLKGYDSDLKINIYIEEKVEKTFIKYSLFMISITLGYNEKKLEEKTDLNINSESIC